MTDPLTPEEEATLREWVAAVVSDPFAFTLSVLREDAVDPKRSADWRYGVRHSLTLIELALAAPPPEAGTLTKWLREALREVVVQRARAVCTDWAGDPDFGPALDSLTDAITAYDAALPVSPADPEEAPNDHA